MTMVLPPGCKVLKAPHRILSLEDPALWPFDLGLVSSAKKDGNRGLCVAGQLLTSSMELPRNRNLWDLMEPLIKRAADQNLVFDYELYDPLQEYHAVTSGVINSEDEALPDSLRAYVFDVMPLEDFLAQSVELPYSLRIQMYNEEVSHLGTDRIVALEQRPVRTVDDIARLFAQDIAAGDEGSIVRALHIDGDPSLPRRLRGGWYKHGRSTENQSIIFKLKQYDTIDGVVVGVEPRMEMLPGAPRRTNASGQLLRPPAQWYKPTESVGAFVVRYRNRHGQLRECRVNFGVNYSLMERELLWQHHKQGRIVGRWCEFKHMPHGATDNALRIGQFMRFRDDRGGETL